MLEPLTCIPGNILMIIKLIDIAVLYDVLLCIHLFCDICVNFAYVTLEKSWFLVVTH